MNLFVDLETIPDQSEDALENAAASVNVPANYKKPEAIEKYRQEHAEDEYLKTSLKGIAGEICSIAWAINDGEVIGNCRDADTSEAWLLKHFLDCMKQELRNGQGIYPRITWIGHNVIDFDLRFLKQRFLINNIRPPFIIPADARHGSDTVFDTMKEWAGWKGTVSLDALANAFGFEGKGDMSGKDVWPAYQAGEFEKICEYNVADVELTRKIYRRMTWTA
jgi:hypothetical protein